MTRDADNMIIEGRGWRDAVTAMPRALKRFLVIAADSLLLPAALWLAITLRLGTWRHGGADEIWAYIALPALTIPVLVRLGLYRAVIRFISSRAMKAALMGVTASTLLLIAITHIPGVGSVPRSSFIIYWALAMLYVGGSRYVARMLLALPMSAASRVIIYGAGTAGARIASAMAYSSDARPVAFVDDDRKVWGSVINGLRVHKPADLERLRNEYAVDRILLAIPSAPRTERRAVLERLQGLGIRVQTVPDISDILAGHARLEDTRDVDAGDLLGREPVAPIKALFDACIRDKVVMVTGAGGSIGSELCRQIIRLGPRRLVLFEMSELALYNIDRELRLAVRREGIPTEMVSLLGSAHHKHRVREIMLAYGVQTVYHAAAYKHVPIVEQNVIEGIHNNVISTWYSAEAALECGVEAFVLISTDKAVNPTNVMGATKRLAEMVLQGLQGIGGATRFCMVRFGNVLESSGSVVPLFREQIRRGGPVTVTHPDVIRYFMTIPEAAQLVLQAGSMAQGGDVFVLDMGQPIRIADLARRMIKLSGLTVRDDSNPQGDVAIEFTGLRPAEKLYEELLIGKDVTGTEHPMILRAVEHSLAWDEAQPLLNDLLIAMAQFDVPGARALLLSGVREYRPTADESDLVWVWRDRQRSLQSKVTNIETRRQRGRLQVGPVPD
jgi:FlaA1/EpsC-like NDP-sugar epimerase